MRSHKTIQQGQAHILYDPDLIPQVGNWLFEPAELELRGLLRRRTSGRRSAYVFEVERQRLVLRHYWRGGMIGRILTDRYLWMGVRRTRPAQEWDLLSILHNEGLPVPRPAAMRIIRVGVMYRADLVTVEIPKTRTLADRLIEAPLPNSIWQAIGNTLKRLHHHGAYHADLNARNILLNEDNEVFVIDWDRGRLRPAHPKWQFRNLDRLFRSLKKISSQVRPLHYIEEDARRALLDGYRGQ